MWSVMRSHRPGNTLTPTACHLPTESVSLRTIGNRIGPMLHETITMILRLLRVLKALQVRPAFFANHPLRLSKLRSRQAVHFGRTLVIRSHSTGVERSSEPNHLTQPHSWTLVQHRG